MGKLWNRFWRGFKFRLIRLLRINKGAHQVALGFVLGFFPCWYPTFGIGPAMSIALTKILSGNVVAAVISTTFGSILWPVLFYMNFKMGGLLRETFAGEGHTGTDVNHFNGLLEREGEDDDEDAVDKLSELEYGETVEKINDLSQAGIDFLVGSVFNSVLGTVLGYFLFRFILSRYKPGLLRMLARRKGRTHGDIDE